MYETRPLNEVRNSSGHLLAAALLTAYILAPISTGHAGNYRNLNESLQELSTNNELTIADFGQSYGLLLARNPWWPNFMIREVLFSEGPTKEAVVKKFGAIIGPKLLGLVQQEIENGHYREDLNPQLTIIAFMAMTIFPFLARPVIEQVFSMNLDEKTVAAISAHNTQLFLHGVTAKAGPGT